MHQLTLDDLKRIMEEDVRVDMPSETDNDILDVAFTDLGCDSLALFQISLGIEEVLRTRLPDDLIEHMTTPRLAIAYVNSILATSEVVASRGAAEAEVGGAGCGQC